MCLWFHSLSPASHRNPAAAQAHALTKPAAVNVAKRRPRVTHPRHVFKHRFRPHIRILLAGLNPSRTSNPLSHPFPASPHSHHQKSRSAYNSHPSRYAASRKDFRDISPAAPRTLLEKFPRHISSALSISARLSGNFSTEMKCSVLPAFVSFHNFHAHRKFRPVPNPVSKIVKSRPAHASGNPFPRINTCCVSAKPFSAEKYTSSNSLDLGAAIFFHIFC
jgi:hypothetical protein